MFDVQRAVDWIKSIDWTPEAVTAAGTVALAFLTLILAIGTVFLWFATRRLVRGSEKTAERQLRAFVFFQGCDQARSIVDTPRGKVIKEMVFWANMENVGLTPATDVGSWINHQTFPMSENCEPHFVWGETGNTAVVGPRGKGKTVYHAIPIEILIELWENRTAIYLATRVEYRDIFDPSVIHHHEQCARLDLLYHPSESRSEGHPLPVVMTSYGPQNTVA